MITYKKGFDDEKVERIGSYRDCSHRKLSKVALYCLEDCPSIDSKEVERCIELIRKWFNNPKSVSSYLLEGAAYGSFGIGHQLYIQNYYIQSHICTVAGFAARFVARSNHHYSYLYIIEQCIGNASEVTKKYKEYWNCLKLNAYEDLDFPHRDFSKTFNLDNPTDLNVFLDFLTDNYPEAITYPREEYFTKRFPKEYLKVIYQ